MLNQGRKAGKMPPKSGGFGSLVGPRNGSEKSVSQTEQRRPGDVADLPDCCATVSPSRPERVPPHVECGQRRRNIPQRLICTTKKTMGTTHDASRRRRTTAGKAQDGETSDTAGPLTLESAEQSAQAWWISISSPVFHTVSVTGRERRGAIGIVSNDILWTISCGSKVESNTCRRFQRIKRRKPVDSGVKSRGSAGESLKSAHVDDMV